MPRSDSDLVQACLAGDAAAWDELIDRYGRLIYSIPRRLGIPTTDADDVFQTVAGIMLRRLDSLRDMDKLSAWLIRTTYREAWRFIKRRRAAERAITNEDEPTDAPSDELVAALERQHLVRQALERLDTRCRALLDALFYESPSPAYEDIAARLNMKVGSIGPTRARCFQKLEAILREFGL